MNDDEVGGVTKKSWRICERCVYLHYAEIRNDGQDDYNHCIACSATIMTRAINYVLRWHVWVGGLVGDLCWNSLNVIEMQLDFSYENINTLSLFRLNWTYEKHNFWVALMAIYQQEQRQYFQERENAFPVYWIFHQTAEVIRDESHLLVGIANEEKSTCVVCSIFIPYEIFQINAHFFHPTLQINTMHCE